MINILTLLIKEPVIFYSSLDCLYRISCQVPLHNDRCVKAGEPIFGEPAWGPWEESECAGLDHYLYCTPRLRTACNLPFLPLPLSSVTRALFRIVRAARVAAAPLSLVGLAPARVAVPPALRPPRPHVLRGELTRRQRL